MTTSVLVLGAGFGGLELSTRLSEELGDQVDITLIDRADAFVFGYSKLDVMFGTRDADGVRLRYADITTPHVRFRQETVTAIDPEARRVTTDLGDVSGRRDRRGARRRLRPRRHAGSGRGRQRVLLVRGSRGRSRRAAVASVRAPRSSVCAALRSSARRRPARPRCSWTTTCASAACATQVRIQVVMPFGTPVPPSPDTSEAILATFAERGIEFVPGRAVASLDPDTHEAVLDDGTRLRLRPVPRHPGASRAGRGRGVGHDRRTAGSRWTRGRSPPGSPASTRWAT